MGRMLRPAHPVSFRGQGGGTWLREHRVKWPDHFPDDCPPPESIDANGHTVYRLVGSNPPTKTDFRSYYDKGRAEGCQARGLSVFLDRASAQRLMEIVPAMRERQIARADLGPGMGRIARTPSGRFERHHTLWVVEGPPIPLTELFRVVG